MGSLKECAASVDITLGCGRSGCAASAAASANAGKRSHMMTAEWQYLFDYNKKTLALSALLSC